MKRLSAATWSAFSITCGPLLFAAIWAWDAILRRTGTPLPLAWVVPLARLGVAGSVASMICASIAMDRDSNSRAARVALFLSILNLVVAVGGAG